LELLNKEADKTFMYSHAQFAFSDIIVLFVIFRFPVLQTVQIFRVDVWT